MLPRKKTRTTTSKRSKKGNAKPRREEIETQVELKAKDLDVTVAQIEEGGLS